MIQLSDAKGTIVDSTFGGNVALQQSKNIFISSSNITIANSKFMDTISELSTS
jgi:hypothetical protein